MSTTNAIFESLEAPTAFLPVSQAVLIAALQDFDRALLIFDNRLRVIFATEKFWTLLEISGRDHSRAEQVLEVLSRSTLNSDSTARALNEMKAVMEGSQPNGTAVLKTLGEGQAFSLQVRALSPGHFSAAFEKERRRQERIEALPSSYVNLDALTGVANRVSFEIAVNQTLSRTPPAQLAVMLVDLDRFKAVNDTLGHAAGDTVLKLAAERLLSAVRAGDLIARFGGDEFAVLLDPAPTQDEPCKVGQRILDLVQRTYMIEGQLVNVGVSVGIALSPMDGRDCKTLLRNADLALYQAKAAGRAMYQFFDSSMEQRASARRLNEIELRKALALRQLELHYQPQVDTPTGRLVGFEALIRWRHPEKGLIPPNLFLPLAEEIGVIVPIGNWVLRTACREAMKWPAHITIAVNASPLQFDAGTFGTAVRQALKASGLPGERLEIEITEGILLRNDGAILKTLHDLRAMKVRIAMDDFGTGYASLSQLARFPFDKIKIDKSLAGFEGDDLKQRAIVRAITALGQSLGVCTLAEGVETADQLKRLQADGCASVQGYLFGKAVPAEQLEGVISQFADSASKEN